MKTKLLTRSALMLMLLLSFGFSRAQSTACPTDFNRDAITDNTDYNTFIAQYGNACTVGVPCPTDLNSDGVTNINDFLLFTPKYGKRCNVLIFNLSGATFSGGYVDVPLSMSTDIYPVSGLDFALKFDENKLTFDSVISVPFNTSDPMYYFHPIDRTLRYTTTILTSYPNDTTLLTIRFATSATSLSPADFNSILALINGNQYEYFLR